MFLDKKWAVIGWRVALRSVSFLNVGVLLGAFKKRECSVPMSATEIRNIDFLG